MTNKALLRELLEKVHVKERPVMALPVVLPRVKAWEERAKESRERRRAVVHKATFVRLMKEVSKMQAGKRDLSRVRRMLAAFRPWNWSETNFVEGMKEGLAWRLKDRAEGRRYPTMR